MSPAMPTFMSGGGSPRSMRWRSAVASASRPARVRRVASAILFGSSMSFMSRASFDSATIERPSSRPVGERGLDRRTGVQRSQHDDRGDRRASELRRDIGGDTGEAKHLDVQHLSGCTHRFEVFSAVVPQTEVQTLSDRGLLDHVGVAFELVTDCGSNEIGPVRVKALLNHQIDMTKVDIADIDRDFLAVTGLWSQLMDVLGHPTILQ